MFLELPYNRILYNFIRELKETYHNSKVFFVEEF